MTTSPFLRLPVLREIDVLVVGACAGAVAAAVEITRQGRSAMVVSDLSYFGEESAGTLNLWPAGLDRSDALISAMFPDATQSPVQPNAVKRALESALIHAAVPFLYLARPIAVLRNDAGGVVGVVIAARTSLCIIRCRAVVDATRYGVVAKLAGTPLAQRPELPATRSWVVLAHDVPAGWEHRAEELHPPFRQVLEDGETTFGAYRLQIDRATLAADPRVQEHAIRASLVAANVLVTADILADVPAEMRIPSSNTLSDSPTTLADSAFTAVPDIYLMNGLLPLTLQGVSALERSDIRVSLGRHVGALAAGALRDNPLTPHAQVAVSTGGEVGGNFRFASAFLRRDDGLLDVSPLVFPSLGRCDVVIAGGGTGGAPAGISAARAGAKTVVLETQHGLGGVGTLGLIAAYWFGNTVGFTAELDEAVMRIDPESRAQHGTQWSPEVKAAVYQRMLQHAGGVAWMGSYAFGVRLQGNQLDGVLVSTPFGCGLLEAGCVVDATGNADLAAAAGAPCRVIDAAHLATQGTGLSPRLHPGVRSHNSDFTFVDETDPEGITAAFVHARAKFPDSFNTSPIVDSRERRQIIGEYEISPLDILARRTFPDTVYTARSNFDTHGFIVHPVFMVAAPDHEPLQADVPFRCLLPQGVEGLLVIGLGMSAHRDALPVLRMQADVQNQGYAAGLAAAMAAADTGRLRELDIRTLQRRLVAVGNLTEDVPTHEDSFPLPDAAVAHAAAGKLTALMNAAMLFAHPEHSRPLLLRRLATDADATCRLDAALILGLMGCADAAPLLAEAIRGSAWDEGWNYRGMGQFGPSMSRLDAMMLALARTGASEAVDVIAVKIRELLRHAEFSHCRVAALATALLRDTRLADAIAALLREPGMQGHAQQDLRTLVLQSNGDRIETEARNRSLCELYLARGLYLAGDIDHLGRTILETYTRDLRGHYARHARAVLACHGSTAPTEMA